LADRGQDLVLVAKDGGDQPSDVRIDSHILHRAVTADDEHHIEVGWVDPAERHQPYSFIRRAISLPLLFQPATLVPS
jgi:hypothetical protein